MPVVEILDVVDGLRVVEDFGVAVEDLLEDDDLLVVVTLALVEEVLMEVWRVVVLIEVALPFQLPRSVSLRTEGSLYTFFLKSSGL